MIQELTAEEMESRARIFVSIKTKDNLKALEVLKAKYTNVRLEGDYVRVYDEEDTEGIVKYLIEKGCLANEIKKNKVGLEEYYIELMSKKEME